jgi:S-adenosylmethionine:tRNA ribosyltransferase-isomerase
VIPARLDGRRGQAKVSFNLHRQTADDAWIAFARPAKKLKPDDRVTFGDGLGGDGLEGKVLARDGGEVRLRFSIGGGALENALRKIGRMPLPPYIHRKEGPRDADRVDYQTMFARRDGAVAAPTAGLHFTPALIQALADRGVGSATVTLHVGAGTFLPVTADDTRDHRMHAEYGEIGEDAATAINAARARGGRIVAVGSTSLRLMESAADEAGAIRPFAGETDIFITPGYRFRTADLMLTNFHLPRSTLFMLVAAFAGLERMRGAYAHAIASGYRFYSYGDACLLSRAA